ncbi:5813_t:CDS:2, partial [Dentiscutata heterogama]
TSLAKTGNPDKSAKLEDQNNVNLRMLDGVEQLDISEITRAISAEISNLTSTFKTHIYLV